MVSGFANYSDIGQKWIGQTIDKTGVQVDDASRTLKRHAVVRKSVT